MNLILTRHGTTNWNIEDRLQGSINTELIQIGKDQAKEVGDRLVNEKIDLIICSPLKRCVQTANIINQDLGLPIVIEPFLEERNYGKLEGLNAIEMAKQNVSIRMLWDIDLNYSDNNVECLTDFVKRIEKVLKQYTKKYHDETVLFVTHSGNTIVIDYIHHNYPINCNFFELGLKNGEIKKYFNL